MRDAREAGAIAVRARLTEAGDAQQDQPRIDLAQSVVTEPPLFEGPRAKVFADDVADADQAAKDIRALRLSEVEGHRLLVACLAQPAKRGALCRRRAEHPERVARAG